MVKKMSEIGYGSLRKTKLVKSDISGAGKTYLIQKELADVQSDLRLIDVPILSDSTMEQVIDLL